MSRAWILVPVAVFLLLSAIWCGANDELTSEEKTEVIEGLSSTLQDYFVFPDVGMQYAEMLSENLQEGSYDEFVDRKSFAERVTKDLKSLHDDRHLSLKDLATHQEKMAELKSSMERKETDDTPSDVAVGSRDHGTRVSQEHSPLDPVLA